MSFRVLKISVATVLPLVAAGCTTSTVMESVTSPTAGFTTVSLRTSDLVRKETVWVQSSVDARAVAERVKSLVRGKRIDAATAVQVALLNNKGLQAAYSEIGMSSAELLQATKLVNPTVTVGITGVDPVNIIETTVAANILALATQRRRIAIADARFRQAQLRAAEETLRLAADTRRAWINAVSAWEAVTYLNRAQVAADAASELAKKLGETGAFTKTGQAREHVFYAELAGQTAKARLAARKAKEELTRLMGLWGADVDYTIPNALPSLPLRVAARKAIEADALHNRVDLEIARLELEALAKSYSPVNATRYVTDIGVLGGVEIERTVDAGKTDTELKPRLEVNFTIPIFDSGDARLRKVEFAYIQAANRLAEKAVNIRSEARGAYDAYRSTYDIARHYRNNVLPLSTTIEEQSVLTYSGMITNTFELLADTRAKIDSIMLSLNAKRQFWLAEVDLGAAIYGGGGSSGSAAPATLAADSGGGH